MDYDKLARKIVAEVAGRDAGRPISVAEVADMIKESVEQREACSVKECRYHHYADDHCTIMPSRYADGTCHNFEPCPTSPLGAVFHAECTYPKSPYACTKCGKKIEMGNGSRCGCWCGRWWCGHKCADQDGYKFHGDSYDVDLIECNYCRGTHAETIQKLMKKHTGR